MSLDAGITSGLAASGLFFFLTITVLILIWLERKILARIQKRMGPMRVGFHGTLQSLADSIKLLVKEDILPAWADRRIYWVAPIAVFVPSFMIWVTIPFGRDIVIRNLDLGLFYIVAISVLSVLGLVMAGWGSANKYAVLGGLRAAGQLLSYEIPFIMAILSIAMISQTLDLQKIVNDQSSIANILKLPLGFFIFFLAGLAELGRTPFDIHHAESEVVGGPFVEYSGIHWSVFFLAEYINTFSIAVLTTLLFLGGWRWPDMPFDGIAHSSLSLLLFFVKSYAVILLIFWFRGTYPRLRIDQLMVFGWKILVPLSFLNILITGCVLFYEFHWTVLSFISCTILISTAFLIKRVAGFKTKKMTITIHSARDLRKSVPAKTVMDK